MTLFFLAESRLFLLYFVSNFSLTSSPILVPNKYYMSSLFIIYFSYFDPLFCVQDNLKMAQSNILKFNTHMYRHIHKTQQIFRP